MTSSPARYHCAADAASAFLCSSNMFPGNYTIKLNLCKSFPRHKLFRITHNFKWIGFRFFYSIYWHIMSTESSPYGMSMLQLDPDFAPYCLHTYRPVLQQFVFWFFWFVSWISLCYIVWKIFSFCHVVNTNRFSGLSCTKIYSCNFRIVYVRPIWFLVEI